MKKLIFTAVAIAALVSFASCAKQTDDYIAPAEKNAGEVTVSFVANPTHPRPARSSITQEPKHGRKTLKPFRC